jgi:hypothetical protein
VIIFSNCTLIASGELATPLVMVGLPDWGTHRKAGIPLIPKTVDNSRS